uniref:Uncharacterized protein n=1 Tax=Sphaerodactylus townsendi TaxID=933632 RepID=A0ACB8ELH0_9SAUR
MLNTIHLQNYPRLFSPPFSLATASFATNLQAAERNRAASKVPKLGKTAAARGKSMKKTSWMKEPAHRPKEQCCSSMRGAAAARRKGARAYGAHSAAGLCRGSPSGAMDHLTAGAQEKSTLGAAQPTEVAHGSGGPRRGLPDAELPNAPLASSTWLGSPPLRGLLPPLCTASVDCAAPDVPFSWAGHVCTGAQPRRWTRRAQHSPRTQHAAAAPKGEPSQVEEARGALGSSVPGKPLRGLPLPCATSVGSAAPNVPFSWAPAVR